MSLLQRPDGRPRLLPALTTITEEQVGAFYSKGDICCVSNCVANKVSSLRKTIIIIIMSKVREHSMSEKDWVSNHPKWHHGKNKNKKPREKQTILYEAQCSINPPPEESALFFIGLRPMV